MKRAILLLFGGFASASLLASMSYYVLELRGGSRIFALDEPVRKGRVVLFHRYPDGAYMSLAAGEVERVVTAEQAPQSDEFAPGQLRIIGNFVEGPGYEAPPEPRRADSVVDSGYGYGYSDPYCCGTVLPPGPSPRPPSAPTRIGPNGFPIIAPPGTPGSVPPAIGSNGFPILAQPVSPRRRP